MENLSLFKEKERQEVVAEKQVSADLQAKLDHQNKNIKMLTGTKQLDKILCAGRTESSHMGLGYTGRLLGVSSVESLDTTKGSAISTSTGSIKCGSNGSSGGLGKRIKSG
ncbi:hypothetical protein F2Q70_00006105 [Brassica cretica]|uniref:Uncharacterized protein n=1 Tax=Brassica cretica TaxID=69181 RepID=A0A8S9IT45_BRACR|nr:hypothetical protein F2Q70_00006105 [Brassica cretica]